MKIKARQCATKVTKNRIHNHGPDFNIVKTEIFIGPFPDLSGKMCHLLESFDAKGERWWGWVPADDVEIIKE